MSSKVIDFFSRKDMERFDDQDYEKNERDAEQFGKYVGVLPKYEAKVMRDMIGHLRRKRGQIDALMQEFEQLWEDYGRMLMRAVALLGKPTERFDPFLHDLYVDQDGHCWMVNIVERDEDQPNRDIFAELNRGDDHAFMALAYIGNAIYQLAWASAMTEKTNEVPEALKRELHDVINLVHRLQDKFIDCCH